MKNTSNKIKTISEIGMFAALGFVFDALQGIFTKGIFVNGGSIGFAMIAVLIVGLRRGFLPALLTGLIMGLLDVADGAYVLNFWQLCLDYIFPYMFQNIYNHYPNKLYLYHLHQYDLLLIMFFYLDFLSIIPFYSSPLLLR